MSSQVEEYFKQNLKSLIKAKAHNTEPRSNFISKFVGEGGINCFLVLDHYSDGQGSIQLYFMGLNQVVRVQPPQKIIHSIKNLCDDQVMLLRMPENLRAPGYLLFISSETTILVYHIKPGDHSLNLFSEQICEYEIETLKNAHD